jgi:hypothetical protein
MPSLQLNPKDTPCEQNFNEDLQRVNNIICGKRFYCYLYLLFVTVHACPMLIPYAQLRAFNAIRLCLTVILNVYLAL